MPGSHSKKDKLKKKIAKIRKAQAPKDLKKRRSKNRYSENVLPNQDSHGEMSTRARGYDHRWTDGKYTLTEGTKGLGKQKIRDPLGDPRDLGETLEEAKLRKRE